MRELCVPSEVEESLATVRACPALLFEFDIHQILTTDFFVQSTCLIVDRPFDVVGMRDVDKEVGRWALSGCVRDESDAWGRRCKVGVNAVLREVVRNDNEVGGVGVDRVKELSEEIGRVSTSGEAEDDPVERARRRLNDHRRRDVMQSKGAQCGEVCAVED